MTKMNLFQLEQAAATAGEEVARLDGEVNQALADVTTKKETRKDLQEKLVDAQERFAGLQGSVEKAREQQRSKFKSVEVEEDDPKAKKVNAYAQFIKDAMSGAPTDANLSKFNQALTANTTTAAGAQAGNGNGEAFLPINVSTELIAEPFQNNPLRDKASYSQIVNLRMPRISVEFGDEFKALADGAAAKEVEVKGDTVTFGRFMSKVRIGLSDTVLAGTKSGLVDYVNGALVNGVSQYELGRAFATKPEVGEEHMSFYSTENAIKHVTGADKYLGIKRALADLDDAYIDNATVFMSKSDYFDIIEKLANNNATLYTAQPESVLGAPVVFTSKATSPVVGDFSQYQGNYDPMGTLYEPYKKQETGINYFQVTAWYDARIKLASGFRIVDVVPASK